MTEPTLEFLGKQLERVLTELGTQGDELRVLSAITMRVDNTTQRHEHVMLSLMEELRATHQQISRIADRLRKLEDAS
jgi:hypothetical protein